MFGSLFTFCAHSARDWTCIIRPVTTSRMTFKKKLKYYHYSVDPHTTRKSALAIPNARQNQGQSLGGNEVERTGKAEIRKEEIPRMCEACMAIF